MEIVFGSVALSGIPSVITRRAVTTYPSNLFCSVTTVRGSQGTTTYTEPSNMMVIPSILTTGGRLRGVTTGTPIAS